MISTDYLHCTYCRACIQACPQKCISTKETEDGFRFPVVDESLCVNCGKCNAVCPIEKVSSKPKIFAYAARSKQKEMLDEASSGGVFGAIAECILKKNGVVYGCAFSQQFEAKHIRVDSIDDLHLLFGSKYVQSDVDKSYNLIKKDLEADKWVVFSGTPCQVAGLRHYLGNEYEKLVLVDLVCHGVPSQAYFDKYRKWLEEREGGRLLDYQFRSKKNHGWSLAGEYTIIKENGNKKKKKLFYFDHYYYHYFLESSIYRECCYSCKYANLNRVGDFSLGDLWGAERLQLDFDISRGCSLLLVNTDKAHSILNELDIHKKEIDIKTAVKYNEQLVRPSSLHPDRENRLRSFTECSGDELQKKFLAENRFARIKGKIKYLVPVSIARYINKIRYKLSLR